MFFFLVSSWSNLNWVLVLSGFVLQFSSVLNFLIDYWNICSWFNNKMTVFFDTHKPSNMPFTERWVFRLKTSHEILNLSVNCLVLVWLECPWSWFSPNLVSFTETMFYFLVLTWFSLGLIRTQSLSLSWLVSETAILN